MGLGKEVFVQNVLTQLMSLKISSNTGAFCIDKWPDITKILTAYCYNMDRLQRQPISEKIIRLICLKQYFCL